MLCVWFRGLLFGSRYGECNITTTLLNHYYMGPALSFTQSSPLSLLPQELELHLPRRPAPPHPRPCGWAFLRRWPSSPALAWLRRWRRMRCRSSSTCVELGLRWARPHPPPLLGCLHPPLLELAFAAVAPRRRLLSHGRRPCAVAFQPLRLAVAFAGAAWPRRNRLAAP